MSRSTGLRWLLRSGVAFFLCIALFVFSQGFIGFLFHPWSYTVTGRPTLTGDWTGRLESKTGGGNALFLKLRLNMASVLSEDGGPLPEGGPKLFGWDLKANTKL